MTSPTPSPAGALVGVRIVLDPEKIAALAPGETEATLRAEVERLKERLEIDHAYDGAGRRIPFPEGLEHHDAVSARDDTIAQLDERCERLRAEVERLTQEGFHLAANQCEGPMQMGEGGHAYCPVVENLRAERDRLSEEKRVLREALSKGAMTMESNGPRQHYEIRIRFTGLDDMHTAGRALVTARDLNQESPNGNP